MARRTRLPLGVSIFKPARYKDRAEIPYTIVFRDARGRRKWVKGFTDYDATFRKAWELHTRAEQERAGLIDPVAEHQQTEIGKHLSDMIADLRRRGRAEQYVKQVERRITRVIKGTAVTRLADLDAVKIGQFLAKNIPGDRTRNEYVTSLRTLSHWAVRNRRLPHDPLAALEKTESRRLKRLRLRRALTPEEIARLLGAAMKRPEHELRLIRHGKNKGSSTAKVGEPAIAAARRLGQQRWLAYVIALTTGLRRSEIEALRWADIHLDAQPAVIQLRAETTKSLRADRIVIHPQLQPILRSLRAARVKLDDPVVAHVPDSRVVAADLEFAGIAPMVEHEGQKVYVDFHALRKTFSTMMAAANISPRVRQAQMRHSNPNLTENVYMDTSLLPIADEMTKLTLPALPAAEPSTLTFGAVSVQRPRQRAGGSTGPVVSGVGRNTFLGIIIPAAVVKARDLLQLLAEPIDVVLNKIARLYGRAMGEERAKGFEPSTFTLAT
jgi:integrase